MPGAYDTQKASPVQNFAPKQQTDDETPQPKVPEAMRPKGSVAGLAAGEQRVDTQADALQREQSMLVFQNYFKAMDYGRDQAASAIDESNTDEEESFLGKLLEIAVDAAIAGTAEGLAVWAVESIAVHAIAKAAEHEVEHELAHSEAIQETIKAGFEGAAKAVVNKNDGKTVNTRSLKNEFLRLCRARQMEFQNAFAAFWPAIGAAINRLPSKLIDIVVMKLNDVPAEKMNAHMEQKYLSAWLNFLARNRHGYSKMTQSKDGKLHGNENVDVDGVDEYKTDGRFQRAPKLYGILECTMNKHGDGGIVVLDHVGRDVRDSLRRIGRTFPGMTIGDLKMNMMVRDGVWGAHDTDELIVGADGEILNVSHPSERELGLVQRAKQLKLTMIRMDETDHEHNE